MAGFEQTVAVPGTRDYASPTPDIFGQIAGLPGAYYQGVFNRQQEDLNRLRLADAQRQQDIAKTFQGGLPTNADGSIDYSRAVAMLAAKGDVGALWNGADAMLLQQAAKGSPLLMGGAQPPAPAGSPSGAVPAGGNLAAPAPRAPVQAGVRGDSGSGTITSLVTDRLPSQNQTTGETIGKIASVMGIDPNAQLTPGQVRRAQGLLSRYAPEAAGTKVADSSGRVVPTRTAAPETPAATPQERLADAFAKLPPSANAGTPAATPAPAPPAAAGAPSAAAPVTPQPQAQPQAQPLVPQVPLPKGFTDPQAAILALRAEAARLSANPRARGTVEELNNWASRIEESLKPVSLGPSSTLLDPRTGKVIAEGPQAAALRAVETAGASPTLDADAELYRTTGKLPPNMGRGVQGNAEAKAIRQRAVEQEIQAGGDPADWPTRWQNFQVGATGKRVLEQRATNLRLAENEASSLIPRVRDISSKVSRTQYPSLNSLILAAKKGTGGTDVIKLGVAVESLIPVYARVLKPVGQITEGDTRRASDILDKAWSDGQINAALDQMQVELESARTALNKTLEETRAGSDRKAAEPDKSGKTDTGGGANVTPDGVRWSIVK